MKAGERERVTTLRMITNALQQDAKEGTGDEVAVLQRERKRRIEAADAFRDNDRAEQAAAETSEAELIETYLPEQISEEELSAVVAAAIEQTGACGPQGIGQVMGVVMPQVQGRADGGRVSARVREALGA